jgi:toxin ParE1/3/4
MAEPSGSALWSPEAISDLNKIWDYYASVAGPDAAEKIVREIDQVIRVIEEHPMAGRSRDEVRVGLRSLATEPHVVFYRIRAVRPEIVRVLDGRQDIEDLFANEAP